MDHNIGSVVLGTIGDNIYKTKDNIQTLTHFTYLITIIFLLQLVSVLDYTPFTGIWIVLLILY